MLNFFCHFQKPGFVLTLSLMQTKIDTFANGVDPDETARIMSYLIRIYIVSHFVFVFCLALLFVTLDMSKFKAGRGHFRNLEVKGLMLYTRWAFCKPSHIFVYTFSLF